MGKHKKEDPSEGAQGDGKVTWPFGLRPEKGKHAAEDDDEDYGETEDEE